MPTTINFNDFAQLCFTVDIYCLHGKLTVVWNVTWSNWPKWNLHWRSEFHFAWAHVNADKKVTLYQKEVLPQSEISNQSELTLGLM